MNDLPNPVHAENKNQHSQAAEDEDFFLDGRGWDEYDLKNIDEYEIRNST